MNNDNMDRLPFVSSVLHPTDLSAASDRAFAYALAIALIRQTELTILHVHPDKHSEADWARFPRVREILERWGLLEIGSPRSAVYEKFRTRVEKVALNSRSPSRATVRYLDTHPSDLIVMATEGRSDLSRAIDRSVAESIAGWSGTMTLFVPEKAERGLVSLEDGNLSLRNILIPIDQQPKPTAAIEFARRAAETIGEEAVKITLLHVGDSQLDIPNLVDGANWSWHSEHRQGEVVVNICDVAEKVAADLLVMTTAGYDGVGDVMGGNTTEQVLRESRCPVLAVPARYSTIKY
jgi:nucleotide-binding universal stress UspA family protein